MTESSNNPTTVFSGKVLFKPIELENPEIEPFVFRFNKTDDVIEFRHNTQDVDGKYMRRLTQKIASASDYGVFKVGSNLLINESTGYLSSLAVASNSRVQQLVITVSPLAGAADYTSIVYALSNVVGTAAGGYTDGSITQPSGINSAPSSNNPFLIVLAPGKYVEPERLVIPDYVSIVGSGHEQSIIEFTANADVSISDASAITVGSNSFVQGLAINLNGNSKQNICGIYSGSGKKNVNIKDVVIRDFGTNTSTTSKYGVYVDTGGSEHQIQNLNTHFNLGAPSTYGIFLNNTVSTIDSSYLKLNTDDNTSSNNYGIYVNSTFANEITNTINNSVINLSGAENNYGVYFNKSSGIIKYTDVEVDGDDNEGYAVALEADSASASTTSTVISLTHHTDSRDVISNDGSINFISLGFTERQKIKISGASQSANNGIFTIYNVSATQITLIKNDTLTTEAAGSSITLKELYSVDMVFNQIGGSSNVIASVDSNDFYSVEASNNRFIGGNVNIINNTINYSYPQVIIVSKQEGDFQSLRAALISINDASINKRYIINVKAGNYTEDYPITCKEYVNIIGDGPKNTIITFNNSDATLSLGGGITLNSNMELRGLGIKNITTNTNTTKSVVIYGSSLTGVELRNLDIESSGVATTQYGIYMSSVEYVSSDIDINISGATASSVLNVGWYHTDCKSKNESTDIIMIQGVGGGAKNVGIDGVNSEIELYTPNVHVTGSTTNNGIDTSTTGVNKSVQIFGGQVNGTTNSVISGNNVNMVCNSVRLNGDVSDNGTNNQLVCLDCYQVNISDNSFIPLSSRGEDEETALGTISLGYTAGKRGMTGQDNTLIGVNSGSAMTTGDNNTFMGSTSGNSNTTGFDNTFIGYQSGKTNINGSRNVALGKDTMMNMTQGFDNTSIGSNVNMQLTTGFQNTSMGANSAVSLTTGSHNISIGSNSSYNANGDRNVVIGNECNYDNTSGDDNTVVGHQAGYSSTGSSSVLVGSKSGYANTAEASVMVGFEAGMNSTSGVENTVVGYRAGKGASGSSGSLNTIMGYEAGLSMTTGKANIIIGDEAGRSVTTGYQNILIGGAKASGSTDSAGYALQEGLDNIAVGVGSGKSMTNCENNIMIGTDAGKNITTAGNNILIGRNSGGNLSISSGNNIMVGRNAGGGSAQQGDSIFIGHESGFGGSEANSNESIFIGHSSGYNNTGDKNTYIGYKAGGNPGATITGENNLVVGPYSGYNLTGGARNLIVGGGSSLRATGRQLTTGSDNTMIGNNAGAFLVSGNKNTLLGFQAGFGIAGSASHNVAIGSNSGAGASGTGTGDGNINIGAGAGNNQTTGSHNVGIGTDAGLNSTENSRNVNIGYQSGYSGTTGSDDNVHIGTEAGYNSIGSKNMFTGYRAGYSNTSGDDNLFMGNKAGYQNTTGNKNIGIGYETGYTNETGSKNILIGDEAGRDGGSAVQKNIMLGSLAGKNNSGSKNIFIGSSDSDTSGVGIVTSGEKNIFIGSNVGIDNTSGEKNIFIGAGAGESNTTGLENINIGLAAGQNVSEGLRNIHIGSHTGSLVTSGDRNIMIGDRAGESTGVNVENNIFLGEESGENADQNNLIFIGTKAGKANTSGINNIFIGENAGELNTTARNNIFIGKQAGEVSVGADIGGERIGNNIFIGTEAGKNNTSGTNNIFVGNQAGDNNTTGINNVVIGSNTMINGSAAVSNVVVMGFEAGQNNQADDSILIGSEAGKGVTTGDQNVMIGRKAGVNTSTGRGNIYFGAESGETNVEGSYNIGIGFQALNKFDKDSADTTENGFNIAIGYQAGSNIGVNSSSLGAANNSYKNTILGYQALSQGDANENNVVLGSEACKNVDNVRKFANNVFLGSSAGTGANLSINSVTIGPNAMSQGTGGEFNIVLGQGCGTLLGNDKVLHAYTAETMVQGQQSVIINVPFGSASYYFDRDDTVIIDDNSDKYEGVISNINSEYEGSKTRLTFRVPLKDNITINQNAKVFVEMKLDSSNVGLLDSSKASANTFMGNDSAIGNTTGSKNIAIGEQAFVANKVGKYNNILGSQAGANIISDHNTCFGTKAGNAIDTYSVDYQNTDYTFHSSNNAITSYNGSINFDNLIQSSVIDINGSTSNDGRYKVSGSNTNVIKVEGVPSIKEDGVPEFINNESYFVENYKYNYFNEALTTSAVKIGNFVISLFEDSSGFLQGLDFLIQGIKFDNHSDFLKFKNCVKIKITGSKFNDGIHYLPQFKENINDNEYYIYREVPENPNQSESDSNIYYEDITSDITLESNTINMNIDYLQAPLNIENGLNHFYPNHIFYNFFKEDKQSFRVDTLENKNTISSGVTHSVFVSNSQFVSENNVTDIVFSEGLTYLQYINIDFTNSTAYEKEILINKLDNTIIINNINRNDISYPSSENQFLRISGTTYNDDIYLVERFVYSFNEKRLTVFVSDSTKLIQDETLDSITFERNSINSTGASGVIFDDINNLVTAGDIIGFSVIDSIHNPLNYINGAYVVEITDNQKMQLYDSVYLGNFNSELLEGQSSINKEIYSVNNVSTIEDHAIMNNFLNFQNKELTLDCNLLVDVSNSGNAAITSSVDYAFVDFVPPVMLKITDSVNNANNGYYVVRRNDYPFKIMYLDTNYNFTTTSLDNSITIKSHSVSTTEPFKDLSTMLPGVEYKIFGANFNHLTNCKPVSEQYNGTSGISRKSVYLDESIPIVDDCESKNKLSLYLHKPYLDPDAPIDVLVSFYESNFSRKLLTDSGVLDANIGRFHHHNFGTSNDDIKSLELYNSNTKIKITTLTSNELIIYSLDNLNTGHYIEFKNTSSLDHGLFKVDSSLTKSTEGSNTIYTFDYTSNVNTGGFDGTITGNVRINQFVFGEVILGSGGQNFDTYMLNYLGDNAKFLRFDVVYPRTTGGDGDSAVYRNYYSDSKSLTFEVSSLGSWQSSNIAIQLVEDCPPTRLKNVPERDDLLALTLFNNPYLISLGEPNPSFRPSNIYRKNRGMINKYPSTHSAVNSNISGDIKIYSSNSTIKLENMTINLTGIQETGFNYKPASLTSSGLSGKYYQSLFDTTNFGQFRQDQMITFKNAVENQSSNGGSDTEIYLIDRIEDDETFSSIKNNKLILKSIDPSNYTLNDETYSFSNLGFNGSTQLMIERQPSITTDRFKFDNINPLFNTDNPALTIRDHQFIQLLLVQDNMLCTDTRSRSADDPHQVESHNFAVNLRTIETDNVSNTSIYINPTLGGELPNGIRGSDVDNDPPILGDNNHVILIPTSNLTTSQISNVYFNNYGIRDTFKFYGSNSTIISTNGSLSGFGNNQYIRIEESSNTTINGFYLTDAIEDIETNKLVLQNTTGWADGGSEPTTISAYINTNTINSSNIGLTDLSVFKPGQKLIVSGTDNNNRTFIVSSNVSTSVQSIYCNIDTGSPHTANVTIEDPDYCRLITSMFTDESSSLTTGTTDVEFHSSNSTIKLSDSSSNNLLTNLRPGQTLIVSDTNANDGTITIDENTIPRDSGMTVSSVINDVGDAAGVNATLTKNINIKTIGEPILGSLTRYAEFVNPDASTIKFHHQDPIGNNLVLGSFAGQFAGAKSYCIHNVYIGSKVGQTNHGSGNIFLGNETQLADNEDANATTFNNKFAIYKTNFVGVPSKPLIGGDFSTGVVGINTINPTSLFTQYNSCSFVFNTTVEIIESKIKFVVNGGAAASSFSSFTGTHKILLEDENTIVKPGSIIISSGKVIKRDMLETVVTVNTTDVPKHKAVYGIYSHFEENMANNGEQEKIIDSNGKIIDNPAYQVKKVKNHYSASLGEGCILVTNVNGNIENGDYITTSNISGYGMKQDDDILHNYTVAKCTEDVTWSDTDGVQYQLIGCTYHCG